MPAGCAFWPAWSFPEPHLYPKEYEQTLSQPYDYVIGAVHYIDGMDPYFTEKMTYPLPKMYERYWEEMERMVETGGFQIIAHLDYPSAITTLACLRTRPCFVFAEGLR